MWTLFWVLAVAAPRGEPAGWADRVLWGTGANPWGPASAGARGESTVVTADPMMAAWDRWGRSQLRDGDLVFRLGDTRILGGIFPLSLFIARASGSRFSHVGLVAREPDGPVVYQAVATGVQRQPFAVWMGDDIGAFGLKRLKPEQRRYIPGALAYCRRVFEARVPFDLEFRLDDDRLYCVELVEKAFRSQGLPLSEPVRIGDWKNLPQFPLTTLAILYGASALLHAPITLDQPVYLPGDDSQGLWGSPWLETVAATEPAPSQDTARPMPGGLGFHGDALILRLVSRDLRSLVRAVRAPLALIPH